MCRSDQSRDEENFRSSPKLRRLSSRPVDCIAKGNKPVNHLGLPFSIVKGRGSLHPGLHFIHFELTQLSKIGEVLKTS